MDPEEKGLYLPIAEILRSYTTVNFVQVADENCSCIKISSEQNQKN
jgi:hypothetical protein